MSPPPTPTEPHTRTTSSTPMAAPRRCSASAARSASLAKAIGTGRSSASGQTLAERFVAPAEVGGHRHHPVAPTDHADEGRAAPTRLASDGSRARMRAPSPTSAAVMSSTLERPRGRSIRTRSRRAPAEPDRRRGERIDRDLEGEHDARRWDSGGRPARAGRACRRAPPGSRWRGHRRRARRSGHGSRCGSGPCACTRSERDSGPLSWSSRTIALRFARRTVSLRCPSSSRPLSKVCVPLSQMSVRDSYNHADMSRTEERSMGSPDGRIALVIDPVRLDCR